MAQRESEREGVAVDVDCLALTNGSMQAVTLVAEALTQPGDTVICEEVTYGGTIAAYRALGIDMVGLPVDEQGMRVELLEAKLDELGTARKPKFIYALTTYQNPTGANLSLERRRALIDVAAQRDIPIVEDNCYGDVHYDGEKPPALYAMSDYENIIYLCSLSKILAPGLRLGYFIAQPKLLDAILARRHDAGGNYLAAAVVAELYKDGVWLLTEELNEALKVKKNLVVDGLAEWADDVCVSSNPSGGLFVWVRFPDDVDQRKLAQITAERQFFYAPGANFHIHAEPVPYLRLAFGHVPDDDIKAGMQVFAQCLREARTSNEPRGFQASSTSAPLVRTYLGEMDRCRCADVRGWQRAPARSSPRRGYPADRRRVAPSATAAQGATTGRAAQQPAIAIALQPLEGEDTLANILLLPSDFQQTLALYARLVDAKRETLERLLDESEQMQPRREGRAAQSIIYSRYAELDPNAAVDRIIASGLSEHYVHSLEQVFRVWAKHDPAAALRRAETLPSIYRRLAGAAILSVSEDALPGQRDEIAATFGLRGQLEQMQADDGDARRPSDRLATGPRRATRPTPHVPCSCALPTIGQNATRDRRWPRSPSCPRWTSASRCALN